MRRKTMVEQLAEVQVAWGDFLLALARELMKSGLRQKFLGKQVLDEPEWLPNETE